MASTNKYYKGKIYVLGDVLVLKYDKLYLKQSFDVFRGKLINYTIKYLKNSEYVIVLVQAMEDPKSSFDTKNELKYLNEIEDNSEFKKAILAAIVRQYI